MTSLDEPPFVECDPVAIARHAVDRLYAFRDQYFQQNDISCAASKDEQVKKLLSETMLILDQHQEGCEKQNRAQYFLLRGRALNVLPTYDPKAVEALTRAVKLDFKLVEAWNELGECNWKKGDMEAAQTCYKNSLKRGPNKVSLRNLSMVLRQLGKTKDERKACIKESAEKAKQAVEMDISDGTSWLILGNAYLTTFFALGQNPDLMAKCMAAYQQADKDLLARDNADLHYNRSVALKYEEEYQSSLDGFSRAIALDPQWQEPKAKLNDLKTYLANVQRLINSKGQLKKKKLQHHIQSISLNHLGPYKGGHYKDRNGPSFKLEEIPFSQLQDGPNLEKVIIGKVVCNVSSDDPVPFTFCMVGKDSTCISVTVYNLAQGKGVIIGDTVAIPEPFIQNVQAKHEDLEVNYRNVRVHSPLVLVVNGRKFGLDKQAPSEIAVVAYND